MAISRRNELQKQAEKEQQVKKQQYKSDAFKDKKKKQAAANEGTGEKWAANSKGMDDTVIPLRLPKTVLLSIF